MVNLATEEIVIGEMSGNNPERHLCETEGYTVTYHWEH